MDRSAFWQLIEVSRQEAAGNCMRQGSLLTDRLSRLPPDEIIEFQRLLVEFMDLSYTNDLWAAAYIINGGCSNDCFDYFRAWLIGQGESVFNNAMTDAETLADAYI